MVFYAYGYKRLGLAMVGLRGARTKMKTYALRVLSLLLILGFIGMFLSQRVVAKEQINEISIRVDGLTCPFCAYGLEKKLKRLEGAKKIHIDIDLGIAHIQVREGATIDEKDLKQAVEDAGFTSREITYGRIQK